MTETEGRSASSGTRQPHTIPIAHERAPSFAGLHLTEIALVCGWAVACRTICSLLALDRLLTLPLVGSVWLSSALVLPAIAFGALVALRRSGRALLAHFDT